MAFGRIIYWVTPESHRGFRHTWVPTRFVAIFFIFWDCLSFFIQCVGILFLVANLYKKDLTVDRQTKVLTTTYDILRVGFIMQTIGFGIFALTSIRFIFASKNWRYDWPEGGSSSWKRLAWTVTGSSMLLTVSRILYSRILILDADDPRDVLYIAVLSSLLREETTTSEHTNGHSICSISSWYYVSHEWSIMTPSSTFR